MKKNSTKKNKQTLSQRETAPQFSRGRQKVFSHRKIEPKWQRKWEEEKINHPEKMLPSKNKFYNLWMFPYPSAEGLHAGHAFASTGSDVYGRYMRMRENLIFQPIGYDSFGIHSENYAIKSGEHPKKLIERTTKYYAKQMKSLGHGYDWTRTVTTSEPDYYKWTQWIFLQLFKAGLAYRKKSSVNWCPSCKTVLADEQVIGKKVQQKIRSSQGAKVKRDDTVDTGSLSVVSKEGAVNVCERCDTPVEMKDLKQWFFRITDYADRLLEGLEKINWPEKIKIAQRNWIGRSSGLVEKWRVKDTKLVLESFTTWPHTTWGATFIVIAPEHPVIKELVKGLSKEKELLEYCNKLTREREGERNNIIKEKKGRYLGRKVKNPLTGEEMQVWVANFAVMDYGTGVVKGCPAHDERDFEFARKYTLPIRKVIDYKNETHSVLIKKSLNDGFKDEIERNGWYIMDYEGWGWGTVVPGENSNKFIKVVQKYLKEGPWYVHTDGEDQVVIFKDKVFDIKNENKKAIEHAKNLGIPQEQIDWNDKDNYMFCYVGEGVMVNAGDWTGVDTKKAKKEISDYLVKKRYGRKEEQYHLRDWLISRQRYWGPPIPMIFCKKCAELGKSWFSVQLQNKSSVKSKIKKQKSKNIGNWKLEIGKLLHEVQDDWSSAGWWPVPEENLPVELPFIKDYQPEGEGRGPLANHPEFYKVACPECGSDARRETDVSDTFLDSAWYFLRYPSVNKENSKHEARSTKRTRNSNSENLKSFGFRISDFDIPWSRKITRQWLPVDLYFGGAEHAVLHLMYARFVTHALCDMDYLNFSEPFPHFYAHGLMIKDGAKMSKSRGNTVNPDEYIEKFGSDALRLYLMFMGPMDGYPDFRDTGIEGMRRFIEKLWKVFQFSNFQFPISNEKRLLTKMHQTIKKVTEDIEKFRYNTAIAAIMEYVNEIRSQFSIHNFQLSKKSEVLFEPVALKNRRRNPKSENLGEALKVLAQLIAPFAPHLAEEVWVNVLGQKFSIHKSKWPQYDSKFIKGDYVTIPVQVNGKLRSTLQVTSSRAQVKKEVINMAKEDGKVKKWIEGKDVIKEIFIPGRLVNLLVSP
jgi:leucyl-tRNA synthetase